MKNVKFKLFSAGLVLAMALTFSCSSDDDGGGGDDKGNDIGNYKTVVIGTQTWMAENLNYAVAGSKCYDNDPANCVKYGRLYDKKTAKTVCPNGWHLPDNWEWKTLADGGENWSSKNLKATSDWNNGNGTDDYGFSALPGGGGISDGSFVEFFDVGDFGGWWSASEDEYRSGYGYYWGMNSYEDEEGDELYYNSDYFDGSDIYLLLSVRCLQD